MKGFDMMQIKEKLLELPDTIRGGGGGGLSSV